MLYLLYFTFILLGFIFLIVGFVKKDLAIFLPLLASAMFFFVGISSFNIEIPTCMANETQSWSCYDYTHTSDWPTSYLFYGLGLISIAYAIISALWSFGEAVTQPASQPREL